MHLYVKVCSPMYAHVEVMSHHHFVVDWVFLNRYLPYFLRQVCTLNYNLPLNWIPLYLLHLFPKCWGFGSKCWTHTQVLRLAQQAFSPLSHLSSSSFALCSTLLSSVYMIANLTTWTLNSARQLCFIQVKVNTLFCHVIAPQIPVFPYYNTLAHKHGRTLTFFSVPFNLHISSYNCAALYTALKFV